MLSGSSKGMHGKIWRDTERVGRVVVCVREFDNFLVLVLINLKDFKIL